MLLLMTAKHKAACAQHCQSTQPCSPLLLSKHTCHSCPWESLTFVLGITHYFVRGTAAWTLTAAKGDPQQDKSSFPFPSHDVKDFPSQNQR